MNLNDYRVLELYESLSLLLFSLLIFGIYLARALKEKNKHYIPLILSLYGCIFCGLIIYVFGEGYSGIPFVLISWVFIFSSVFSLVVVLIKHFSKVAKS